MNITTCCILQQLLEGSTYLLSYKLDYFLRRVGLMRGTSLKTWALEMIGGTAGSWGVESEII